MAESKSCGPVKKTKKRAVKATVKKRKSHTHAAKAPAPAAAPAAKSQYLKRFNRPY